MVLARKILFYFFVLLYIGLCPLVILYSFGYILQPHTKEISQTGLIYLETTPPEANIYLEGRRYRQKTPASLTELFPGTYQVMITLSKYRPWKHTVSIEEGKPAIFDNILLIPKNLNSQPLFPGVPYKDVFNVSNTPFMLLKRGNQLQDLHIFNRKKDILKPLIEEPSASEDAAVTAIFPQKESQKMIIFSGSLWDKRFFLVDPSDEKAPVTDISKLFSGKPDHLEWDLNHGNNCFAVYGNHISRIDLASMSIYPKFFEEVAGFGMSENRYYILTKDRRVLEMASNDAQPKVIFDNKGSGLNLFTKSQFYTIRHLYKGLLLFWGDKGDLIVSKPPYEISEEPVLGVQYHEATHRLLFWSRESIWIADIGQDPQNDNFFSNMASRKTVYTEGHSISQGLWFFSGEHIIFQDKEKVFLLQLTDDGKHHTEYLFDAKKNSEIIYDDAEESLYYLNLSGELEKTQIAPQKTTVSLPRQTTEENRGH